MGAYKGKMSPPKTKKKGGDVRHRLSRGGKLREKFSGVGEKKTKPNDEQKITGEKVQFNPAIHSIKTENKYKSKNCFRKREKQKKKNKRLLKKRPLICMIITVCYWKIY